MVSPIGRVIDWKPEMVTLLYTLLLAMIQMTDHFAVIAITFLLTVIMSNILVQRRSAHQPNQLRQN